MKQPSIAAVIVACAGSATFAQDFSRPNTDLCERSFFSDAVPGQFADRRQADDIQLNATTVVSSIRWWGAVSPFGGVFGQENIESFRIVIFNEANGAPDSSGAPVFDQEFPIAQTDPKPTGFRSVDNGIQYQNTATIDPPLTLDPGVNYWITIGTRNVDPQGAAWRWSSSLSGNFRAAQQEPFGGDWQVFDPSGANYTVELNPLPDGLVCLPDGSCIAGTPQDAFTTGGVFLASGDCNDCEAFAVYTQPPSQPCNQSFNSDAVPGQFAGSLSADNFELAADATIDSIRWWGGSQNFANFDLFNFDSWTVTIYGSDASGAPDPTEIVFQQTVDKADTDPTLTLYRNGRNADLYEQGFTLAEPLTLEGNRRYWIAIGTTNFDPQSDGWRWSGSLAGDGISASKNWATGEFTVFTNSSIQYAFQLLGTLDAVTCRPDLNADGVVDADDFFLFLSLFAAGDPRADFNNDGVIDADDFFQFLSEFAQGCP